MFCVRGLFRKFSGGDRRAPHFDIFPDRVTSRNKNSSSGYGRMLPGFFFNLDSVIVILELFVQFLRKTLFKILSLILSPSPNMMHFVFTFRFMLASLLGVRIS